eukprot:11226003-Lingulodinium_polyedra.AAC.1
MPPKRSKRVSASQTAMALKQLKKKQEDSLLERQMQYIWRRMEEEPELIPVLLGVVDEPKDGTSWIPGCTRTFGWISYKHTITILPHVEPKMSAVVWPRVSGHKVPGGTRDLL